MANPKQKTESEPTTLDAALEVIANMRGEHQDALETLENAVADAEYERDEAIERADDALQYACEDLARIHIKMKAGRINEAIDDLDRALQEHDGDGKARMSAVAVMI